MVFNQEVASRLTDACGHSAVVATVPAVHGTGGGFVLGDERHDHRLEVEYVLGGLYEHRVAVNLSLCHGHGNVVVIFKILEPNIKTSYFKRSGAYCEPRYGTTRSFRTIGLERISFRIHNGHRVGPRTQFAEIDEHRRTNEKKL